MCIGWDWQHEAVNAKVQTSTSKSYRSWNEGEVVMVAESAGKALQRKGSLTDLWSMGRIKIGSSKCGDVRRAFRNGTTAESKAGRQIHGVYPKETISSQYVLRLRAPIADSNLWMQIPGPAAYQLCDLASFLTFLKLFLYLNDRDSNSTYLKGLLCQ